MIWLIGNKGMLGTELSLLFEREGVAFVGTDREVDILDAAALAGFAAGKGIGWIVNCAAYTAVDKAEDEAELCRRLNVDGPANLAALTASLGASILHISTDYVFSGEANAPYGENDPVSPSGVYGRTKAEGEAAVLGACPRSVVLRTAWLYGAHGPNFVYTMLRLMKEREEIGVVADQRGTPTWAADLARVILSIVQADKPAFGIYHYTNAGETSWHGFALEIERLGRESGLLERSCLVKPLSTAAYPTKAKRPAYSVLSKNEIQADYGVVPADWRESLSSFFDSGYRFLDDMRDFSSMSSYDLDSARALLDSARYLYVAYSCQQALEKLLKALVCLRGSAPRIHNLLELTALGGAPINDDEKSLLKTLTEFYLKGRYPRDFQSLLASIDRGSAENLFRLTEALCVKLRKHPVFSTL